MIRFFTTHPTAANLLMILLLAAGLISLPSLRRETLPDFTPDEVEVRVIYPGASAEEVEEAICERIEDAIDGIKFIEEVRSDAREGLSIVTVEMENGGDFRTFKDDIDTEVNAIDDFPADVEEPIIRQLGTTDPVLAILVSGPMTVPDLKAYCEDLKRRLQQEPGISLVRIKGFSDHQFRIELSAEALMRYDLSAAAVADIVGRQNVDLPAGAIEARHLDILVRFVEERKSPQELEDLTIIAEARGAEVRLSDIGTVTDLFEVDEDKVLLESGRAGLLHVEKTKNQDMLSIARTVKTFLQSERERGPDTLRLTITQDRSTLVVDRLTMLVRNGWQGLLLVFCTMWLFFNLRLSFWVAMGLPVSFLGAFFFLPLVGLTINMLTMVGLLLALGLLMDDAIVIAENIAAHRARGKSAARAAIDGVSEVRAGVLASFFTTTCVLGPLVSLEGDLGKVLRVVPMVLILVMAVSLVEAFFILPAHLAHSLEGLGDAPATGLRRRLGDLIEWLREEVVGRSVDAALRWRYLFVGVVAMVFLLAVALMAGGVIKFRAFPDLESDVIDARLLSPPGTPLARTEEVVEQIIAGLERVNARFTPLQPGGEDLVRTIKVQFNENTDAFEQGPHVATVSVDLLSAEKRSARIADIVQAWDEETGRPADVLSLVYTEPTLGPAGRPIEIRLSGDDLDRLKAAASEAHAWISRFDGVLNLSDDLRSGKPEVRLRLREGAFGLGLDAASMARQLRAAFHGITADEIQVGSESYEIDVQLRRADQNSLADLEYFHFALPGGKQAPLGAVAVLERGRGWARIARVNGLRTVTLRGDVDPRVTNTAALISEFESRFVPELEARYPEIDLSYEGEIKESGTTQGSMRRALLIGLIGVFILLSFQFGSYIEPLVVMAAIPLSFVGVIGGHLLMGIDLSMPSLLGFVSLAGVVVNDSILLVVFLKTARRDGAEVEVAAAHASRQRFRAIALTSLTTLAGLLPLLAERSLQAQILIPLALSIVFGLLASTILVLLVIPCLYAILGDLGWIRE